MLYLRSFIQYGENPGEFLSYTQQPKISECEMNFLPNILTAVTSIASSIWNPVRENFTSLIGMLVRNSILIVLIFGAYYFGKLSQVNAYVNTMQFLVALECLAIFLSNVALFFYTTINFTSGAKAKVEVDVATSRVVGFIFLSVHLLIGLSVVGIYFTNFQ